MHDSKANMCHQLSFITFGIDPCILVFIHLLPFLCAELVRLMVPLARTQAPGFRSRLQLVVRQQKHFGKGKSVNTDQFTSPFKPTCCCKLLGYKPQTFFCHSECIVVVLGKLNNNSCKYRITWSSESWDGIDWNMHGCQAENRSF